MVEVVVVVRVVEVVVVTVDRGVGVSSSAVYKSDGVAEDDLG